MTVLAIVCVVVIIGLVVVAIYCIMRKNQPSTHQYYDAKLEVPPDSSAAPTVSTVSMETAPPVPKPRPPPMRQPSGNYSEINPYEAYEVIPAETVDPKVNQTIGNPGYVPKSPTGEAEKQKPVEKKRDRANSAPSKHSKDKHNAAEAKRLTLGQYLHNNPGDSPSTPTRKPRRFTKPPPQSVELTLAPSDLSNGHINNGFSPEDKNSVNPMARNPMTTKSNPNLMQSCNSTDEPSKSTTSTTGRASDPLPKTDANSNVIGGDDYLPPASLSLPPKSTMTVLNAQLRAMREGGSGSPAAIRQQQSVESTVV